MTLKMLNASKKDWAASLPKNLAYEKKLYIVSVNQN